MSGGSHEVAYPRLAILTIALIAGTQLHAADLTAVIFDMFPYLGFVNTYRIDESDDMHAEILAADKEALMSFEEVSLDHGNRSISVSEEVLSF